MCPQGWVGTGMGASQHHRPHDYWGLPTGGSDSGGRHPGGLPPVGEVCIQERIGQSPLRYMGYYGIQSTSYWNAFLF